MSTGKVVILAGSPSDDPWVDKIEKYLTDLGVTAIRRIASAHRVPEKALELLRRYDNDDTPTVFITVAGMSDALSGLSAANVSSPVIACPPRSAEFAQLDVLSSMRTPPGVDVMVALEPANAALSAAKILGLSDPEVRAAATASQKARAQKVLDADRGHPGE